MGIINKENEPIEAGSEPLPNDERPHSNNRTGLKDFPQADSVLSDIKNDMQAENIVINIGNETEKDVVAVHSVKKKFKNTDDSVYGHYGQYIRPPQWVMFQLGSPPSGPGLEYDPGSRNGFVGVTLLITVLLFAGSASLPSVVLLSEEMMKIFRGKGFILALPSFIIIILLHLMVGWSPCTRMFPCCVAMLAISALCMTLMITWLSVYVYNEIAAYMFFSTAIALVFCIFLSFTSFDFTSPVLYGITVPVSIASVVMLIFAGKAVAGYFMPPTRMGVLSVFAVLYVILVTMELIKILDESTFELEPYEFFLGAFLLYTSPIDLCDKLIRKLF